jgi:hypothetical protein
LYKLGGMDKLLLFFEKNALISKCSEVEDMVESIFEAMP